MNGKTVGLIAVAIVALQLSVYGFVGWVIYKLLVHFGIV